MAKRKLPNFKKYEELYAELGIDTERAFRPIAQLLGLMNQEHIKWCDDHRSDYEGSNIRIPTELRSRIVVLEVDFRQGGRESLRCLRQLHGQLPYTPIVRTGSVGLHIYLVNPFGFPLPSIPALWTGVNFIGDGGSVLAPPSILPDTGEGCSWRKDRHVKDVAMAEVTDWLLEAILVRELSVLRERFDPERPAGQLCDRLEATLPRLLGYLCAAPAQPGVKDFLFAIFKIACLQEESDE